MPYWSDADHLPACVRWQDIRESIRTEVVRREVRRRFRVFLDTIKDDSGRAVYRQRIKELCAANGSSLSVSYLDLNRVDSIWATWLVDTPEDVLAVLNEVCARFNTAPHTHTHSHSHAPAVVRCQGAMSVVLSMFPDYQQIHPEMHVRITDWPLEDSLRELRQVHMNSLVRTHGVVTRRTGVFPQMKLVKWACGRCSYVIGPLQVGGGELPKPTQCPECQATGPFEINNELTVYRNYQKLTVQESPSEVPAGRVPRQKEVILTGDLVDTVRGGSLPSESSASTHPSTLFLSVAVPPRRGRGDHGSAQAPVRRVAQRAARVSGVYDSDRGQQRGEARGRPRVAHCHGGGQGRL